MKKKEERFGLEKIGERVPEIAEFIAKNPLQKIENRTYLLPKGIYLNMETYKAEQWGQNRFEAHRKYVDLQCVISSEEIIAVAEVDSLNLVKDYSRENDISFYVGNSCIDYTLKSGDCLMLFTNNAHKPCVQTKYGTSTVKKAVFKIPIHYFTKIKLLIMDVDGTLTDGKIYMGNDGEFMKAFNVKDGYGIHNMVENGRIIPIIITGRESPILENRCMELGITELYQGVGNKLQVLKDIIKDYAVSLDAVAYIGDDMNDIECIYEVKKNGGITACPSDAVKKVCDMVDYWCHHEGGKGAVRELIDWLLCDGF